MPQYCFYTEQCKYTSEEQQQRDTVALDMDSVPFSACVQMAHCSCPKTSPLCSGLWVMLHRVFITEPPFTPVYSSLGIFTSLPTSHSVNLLGLQTDWCHPPPSLPDRGYICRGEPHPSWNGGSGKQHLATASGHGGVVFWFPVTHWLPSQCLAASLMAVPPHCTSSTLLVWM